jgi:hypothetical protein
MGFNLIKQEEQVLITINSLTGQMMQDLITCYAADIPSNDIEAKYLLTERTGIIPNYPTIPASVIDEFYLQLDMVKSVIIDLIVGNWHTGNVVPQDQITLTPDWQWGYTPVDSQELKDKLFWIVQRDFHEQGIWIYDYTHGDFTVLRPFLNAIVDLSIGYTSGGDYNVFVNLIKSNYPFTQI